MVRLFDMLLHECTSPTGLRTQEAWVIFKAGKKLWWIFWLCRFVAQTEKVIELFEDNFSGTAVAAFGFDNALVTRNVLTMLVSSSHAQIPKKVAWKHGQCKMRRAHFQMGPPQLLLSRESPRYARVVQRYESYSWGARFLEQGNLQAECQISSVKTQQGPCCCCWILFNQPDFQAQKPVCFELVEANGHIAFFILNSIVN